MPVTVLTRARRSTAIVGGSDMAADPTRRIRATSPPLGKREHLGLPIPVDPQHRGGARPASDHAALPLLRVAVEMDDDVGDAPGREPGELLGIGDGMAA